VGYQQQCGRGIKFKGKHNKGNAIGTTVPGGRCIKFNFIKNIMHPRLKKIIFNKLYEDLKHAEIIHFQDSIWFIDREKKYWYLEYEKNGTLWWRHDFFTNFFLLFSIGRLEYQEIIAEWMKEVLNLKVDTIESGQFVSGYMIEEILNFNLDTNIKFVSTSMRPLMGDALNFKVDITPEAHVSIRYMVEDVLNSTL
jgi:hypothetical protein